MAMGRIEAPHRIRAVFGSRFRQHWSVFEKLGHLTKSVSNIAGVHPIVTAKTFDPTPQKNNKTLTSHTYYEHHLRLGHQHPTGNSKPFHDNLPKNKNNTHHTY